VGNDSKYFSQNYSEARRRFREFNGLDEVERTHFKVPSRIDDELFVDDLYRPASQAPKTLFVLTSGVHGVEASAGSAIQLMFLNELVEQFDLKTTGLYLFHCFNPYGFKYGRRTTENNVNLNRGFGPNRSTFKTPNLGYEKIAHWFEGKKPIHAPLIPALSSLKLLIEGHAKGFNSKTLNQAIGQGQFTHPRGLEYGGTDYEPQVRFFMDRFQTIAQTYDQILLFDLHTGLGERGRLHILTGSTEESRNPSLLKKILDLKADHAIYEFTETHKPGFYRTIGDINTMIPTLVPGKPVAALTLEFATLGASLRAKLDTLERIRFENLGHHAGYGNEASATKVKQRFIELFAPTDQTWQANTIRLARETLSRIALRLR